MPANKGQRKNNTGCLPWERPANIRQRTNNTGCLPWELPANISPCSRGHVTINKSNPEWGGFWYQKCSCLNVLLSHQPLSLHTKANQGKHSVLQPRNIFEDWKFLSNTRILWLPPHCHWVRPTVQTYHRRQYILWGIKLKKDLHFAFCNAFHIKCTRSTSNNWFTTLSHIPQLLSNQLHHKTVNSASFNPNMSNLPNGK